MDTMQFYPTPPIVAAKMIGKFSADPFARDASILEPSAGNGALLTSLVVARVKRQQDFCKVHGMQFHEFRASKIPVDCIEVDFSKHAALEAIEGVKGQVVGLDFLQYQGSMAAYSHILMNPPFNAGVHHVLKAWEGLYDGEVVALINAETLKNPFSKERQRLVRLIEDHGDVEFVQDAFKGEGVERAAEVEVAIVHLVKKADLQHDVIGDVMGTLQADGLHDTGGAGEFAGINNQEIAIPGDVIVRTERAFKAAVAAMKDAVLANARADYCRRLVGKTMSERIGEPEADTPEEMSKVIRDGIATGYAELKDRAWSEVLRSTKVSEKLSGKAQQRLESDFERIKRLDFSASNVYSFLIGLIESQGDMHLQMACDCFDEITSYHEDNTVWYMGWKSNGKHRTAGRRIKMSRFILPRFQGYFSGKSLEHSAMGRLGDFDKVFEVLDGKAVGSSFGLVDLFKRDAPSLASGDRLASDYFEVRWYPGRGTIHFFPKRKDLIDRLNRVVGRARQWLPEREDMVSKDFWLAYERAEKFQAGVDREMGPTPRYSRSVYWQASRDSSKDGAPTAPAQDKVAQACLKVAQANGLDPLKGIESSPQQDLLRLGAA